MQHTLYLQSFFKYILASHHILIIISFIYHLVHIRYNNNKLSTFIIRILINIYLFAKPNVITTFITTITSQQHSHVSTFNLSVFVAEFCFSSELLQII